MKESTKLLGFHASPEHVQAMENMIPLLAKKSKRDDITNSDVLRYCLFIGAAALGGALSVDKKKAKKAFQQVAKSKGGDIIEEKDVADRTELAAMTINLLEGLPHQTLFLVGRFFASLNGRMPEMAALGAFNQEGRLLAGQAMNDDIAPFLSQLHHYLEGCYHVRKSGAGPKVSVPAMELDDSLPPLRSKPAKFNA